MDISQLNLRGRMAYGVACLLAYLNHNTIRLQQYKAAINILLQFTAQANLAEWDSEAKAHIYTKYPDEALGETIPALLDKLYWIGASELYGQPSDCKESENIIRSLIEFLQEKGVPVPCIADYAEYALDKPASTDDYFGKPFRIDPL